MPPRNSACAALAARAAPSRSLDELIAIWLDEAVRPPSRAIYARTLRAWARSAEAIGLDALDGHRGLLAVAAAMWAAATQDPDHGAAPATIASRLTIVASFYATLRRVGMLRGENPIAILAPRRQWQTQWQRMGEELGGDP